MRQPLSIYENMELLRIYIQNSSIHIYIFALSQKSVNDLFFGFFFGKSKRHKLYKLFTRNLADSSLMDKRRIGIYSKYLGNRRNSCVVHNYRITLGMT